MFKIKQVTRIDKQSVRVKVEIAVLIWNRYRHNSELGALYGIDISNAVYREYGVRASNPTVNDNQPARGGIKIILLEYNDTVWAEKPAIDSNAEILAAIGSVRAELTQLRLTGTRAEQVECFGRLIGLYGALNTEHAEKQAA